MMFSVAKIASFAYDLHFSLGVGGFNVYIRHHARRYYVQQTAIVILVRKTIRDKQSIVSVIQL